MPRLTPYAGEDPKKAAERIRRALKASRGHSAKPKLDYGEDEDVKLAYEKPLGTEKPRLRLGGAHLLGKPTEASLGDREDSHLPARRKKK